MGAKHQRKPKGHFWRKLRVGFRRFRITVLFVLFALVGVGAYLNQIGLPGFIKRPVLANLRSRGVDLEFSRLRLRWYRGIVADDVRLLGTNHSVLPQFTARSADVQVNYAALARLKLEVSGVTLNQGRLTWELAATNEPSRTLAITNLTGTLRFLPGDEWSLDDLRADFAGARFQASGQITNATALREWPVFQGHGRKPPGDMLARLRRLHDVLEQIRFTQPPEIRLRLNGDAKDPRSFAGVFTVRAAGGLSPWGDFQNGQLTAGLNAATSNAPSATQITVTAERARTEWVALHELDLRVNAAPSDTNTLHCRATLRAARLRSDWADADAADLSADWSQLLDEPMPREGRFGLQVSNGVSSWVRGETIAVTARFRPATTNLAADAALGWWNRFLPYAGDFTCAVTNAANGDVRLDAFNAAAEWDAPRFRLTQLQARRPRGNLDASAALDVLTRRLDFSGNAHFDFHLLDPVLTDKSRAWINHFTWEQPPSVEMAGHLTLPAWTNRQPDWRGEVQPGIVLDGAASLTNATYRGISALAAASHLQYSNRVWHLPDLALTWPEGTLHVDLQSDEISHDYVIKLRGPFDPRVLASQLDEKGRRGLSYFEFTNAPQLDLELRGRWYAPELIGARGSVVWSNFSYRAQHADRLEASLEYTNKVLQVYHPRVDRGTERATADGIAFDFAANLGYLTNGYTDTDPMAIATAIGPKVAAAVERYQFLKPPVARVYGVIPLKGERDADLHFDLEGGPFHWMQFNLPHIAGHIDWANESVTLTNITASFYDGEAWGHAWFDVSTPHTTPFRFTATVNNADLHKLMSDLHSPTNRLEGILSGQLVVTSANTDDWHTWNGHGFAKLRDGLIWDTPIFGMMSSVMNTVVPGIGNSRASEAGGTYTITNSVIYTRDLDIRASGMRLQYDGTVDFTTRVEARVQAEILRDTWFIGRLVSTALWPVSKLFEYKVTGTLANPEPEPVYLIPKIFLAPLHPMKAIKGVLQEFPSGTNAPPATAP